MTFAKILAGAAVALALSAGAASAAVIAGPTLDAAGGGWSVTGLEFTANDNAVLTSFVYQNQGKADTVILTDASGNTLYSLSTPAASTSFLANVNWNLAAGLTYWLLQTVQSNEYYASYGLTLPSNVDLSIVKSGGFGYSVSDVVTGATGFGANEYWAAFNNITTNGGAVPEPAAWALMIVGFGAAGALLRRRAVALA